MTDWLDMDWLEHLKAQSVAATPGPWEYVPGIPEPRPDPAVTGSVWLTDEHGRKHIVGYKPSLADAALIATLGTIREELLAVVEAATQVDLEHAVGLSAAVGSADRLHDALDALQKKVER